MTKKIIVRPSGVEEVELTAEEVAQRDTDHSAYLAQQEAQVAADAQKATDKANAKAKLIAGEALTQAEADTIVI
jgi:hypothetical protein